ncbi:MAG: hypothetical protein AABW51_02230 [Nanoarchaeota archaeon]
MGLFNRKEKVLDLSERYRSRQKVATLKHQLKNGGGEPQISAPVTPSPMGSAPAPMTTNSNSNEGSGGFFSFLGNLASSSPAVSSSTQPSVKPYSSGISDNEDSLSIEDKKKKFAKRLMDMTTKLEEVSNNIYRLQHRIELVEKKLRINKDD